MAASRLEKARAELARLDDAITSWDDQADAAEAEVAEIEAGAGGEVLDVEAAEGREAALGKVAERIARARATLDAAVKAAAAARTRHVEAQREVWRAEAAEKRAEVKQLQRDLEKHVARRDELLAALEEHEGGAKFVAYEPRSGDSLVHGSIEWTVPLSERLARQDRAARRGADELDARRPTPVPPRAAAVAVA